jgi:hypothetical protein
MANRRFGMPLIGLFIIEYAALFLNFQTVNRKIAHLGVIIVLYVVLFVLKRRVTRTAIIAA